MLFANMTDAFFLGEPIYDEDGKPCDYRFLEVNPAFELNTGLKREQVLGNTIKKVLNNPSRLAIEKYGEVVLSGESMHIEVFSQELNKYLDNYVFSPEKGKFAVIFRDITERKQTEETLNRAYSELQVQSEEIQSQNEELQAQSEELQAQSEELEVQNEELLSQAEEIREANEALQESETMFRTISELNPFGAWECDPNGGVIYLSQSWLDMVGMTLEHCKMFGWTSRYAPGELENMLKAWQHCREAETQWEYEHHILDVNDCDRWILSRGFPLRDEQGNITKWVGLNIDITERKKAEQALKDAYDTLEVKVKERTAELEIAYNSLKESEEKYRNIIETANEGIVIIDSKSKVTYVNKKMEELLGYSQEEITGKSPLDFTDEECKAIANFKRNKIRHDTDKPFELKFIRKDGSFLWVLVNLKCIFDKAGNFAGSLLMFTDITERKKAEKSLQNSEARFRNLYEAISSGVIIYDVIDDGCDFIFKDINPAGERIDHVRREDIIGRSLYELFPNVSEMGLDAAFRRVWNTGRPEFFPMTIYKDNRIALWVTNYIYRLPSGELVAVFEDITERKQAEETLAKVELARKKEIHHRIKNNLQVISSLLDLQSEKFNNRENIRDSEVLEAFRESQDRIISMALIHEELYKGGGFETLNFSSYIEELAENLFKTYRVGNTDIKLKIDLVENAFFDMDTAIPLGIIVNELVTNSFKHAFPYGSEGEIRIRLINEEIEDCSTNYVLTVSDNGVGIPEDIDIEELDTFGMQLVTSLVDQLDGELELNRDNSTKFTIKFIVTEKNNPYQRQSNN